MSMHNVWGVGVATVIGLGSMTSASFGQTGYTVFAAQSSLGKSDGQPTGRASATAPVTLIVQDSTVKYVVRELTRQAHLQVLYDNTNPRMSMQISLHVEKVAAMSALAMALKGTGLVAKLESDGETVVIRDQSDIPSAARTLLNGGAVGGAVYDSASGQGLPGATVKIEGTKLATITSDSGYFALLNVPVGEHVLSIRRVGYKFAERTVTVMDSGRTLVRVALVPAPTVLSGVVTTATGLQRKIEVGNDISTLNVDSIMQVAPISSVTDLLETRVPGLTVVHSSGVPGDPSRIRIRGAGSILGNNDPIIIVNGIRVYSEQSDPRNNNLAPPGENGGSGAVHGNDARGAFFAAPSPLDQIDPNSIATIEVLKGPSATAIYGSDAAAGVIVITTKHGQVGPTHWTLDVGDGVNWLPGTWPVNYYRFGASVQNTLAPTCAWNDLGCHVDSIVPFQALNTPQFSVFSHGRDQTGALTVSGGSSTLQYSLTGSTDNNLGYLKLPAIEQQRYENYYGAIPGWMLRPDNYQRWSIDGQFTMQLRPTAHVTLQSSLLAGTQQRSSLESAIAQLEGEYLSPAFVDSATVPLIQNDVERATDQSVTSTNAITLSWQPLPWFPLTATGGLNSIQRVDETLIPYGITQGGIGYTGGEGGSLALDTTGFYGLGHGTSQDKTLTVGTNIPLKLLTLALGANLDQQSTADFQASTNQLAPGVTSPNTFPTTCGQNSNCSQFTQATTAWSTYGWYVVPNVKIANLYINPGFRLDGGSTSGANAGLTGFPKIDLSYVAIDQSRPRGWISLLRPRLAFGYGGTQPGPTEKLRLFNATCSTASTATSQTCGSQEVVLNDSTTVSVAGLTSLGNTHLQPERTSELEGGIDAELWHGRFSMTYTQYNKTRHNAIITIPVAPSVNANVDQPVDGVGIYDNIGEIRNTGTEVTANVELLQSRLVSWNVGANLSTDQNVVVHLNHGQQPFCLNGASLQAGGGQCVVPGFPLFSDFVRPIVAFEDANHNGLIDPNEIRYGDSVVYVGQQDPKYELDLNTGVTLLSGRLSINATFAYQRGLTQNNQAALTSGAILGILNQPNTPLAVQAAAVAASCSGAGVGASFNSNSTIGCSGGSTIGLYQTVNLFRFHDLSVSYTLPTALFRRFGVPRAVLALQGSNLGLSTNYRGKDPGVNAFSTVSAGDETADLGQIPEPRMWWLKLTLGN